jgi:methylenetetrahydrofolate reductase (NADPH)
MVVTGPRTATRRWRARGGDRAVAALLDTPRYEIVPLHGAIEQAHALPDGAIVTVTSSPTRGAEATIALAEELAGRGFHAVPHLAARQVRDEAELAAICRRLERVGITDVFVVGGDAVEPAGEFPDGLTLLQAIDRLGYRFANVGIPGYPEGHHAIDDETLWAALKAKRPYATYLVTQMCFDPDTICRFVAAAADRGVDLPVYVGVPGAVDVGKLLRISLKIGVGESLRFVRGNAAVARRLFRPRLARGESPGVWTYRPDGLVRKLAARTRDDTGEVRCPIAGLHLYTFNQVGATVGWVHQAVRAHADAD